MAAVAAVAVADQVVEAARARAVGWVSPLQGAAGAEMVEWTGVQTAAVMAAARAGKLEVGTAADAEAVAG